MIEDFNLQAFRISLMIVNFSFFRISCMLISLSLSFSLIVKPGISSPKSFTMASEVLLVVMEFRIV